MAAIVNTFLYSGTLQQVTIPPGTQSIDVYLWGGAGGGGGSDAGGPGGTGAAGHFLEHTGFAISSGQIGTTLEVAVGGGGAGGGGSGGVAGGNGTANTGGGGGGSPTNGGPGSGTGGSGIVIIKYKFQN